jgi:hypothetical protein
MRADSGAAGSARPRRGRRAARRPGSTATASSAGVSDASSPPQLPPRDAAEAHSPTLSLHGWRTTIVDEGAGRGRNPSAPALFLTVGARLGIEIFIGRPGGPTEVKSLATMKDGRTTMTAKSAGTGRRRRNHESHESSRIMKKRTDRSRDVFCRDAARALSIVLFVKIRVIRGSFFSVVVLRVLPPWCPAQVPRLRSRSASRSATVSKPGRSELRSSSRSQARTFFSAEITVEWLRPPKYRPISL